MPHAKLGDVSLYYEIEGEGPPLVLIAGLGSDLSAWATVKPLLTSHYRVVTFDNRGVGRSDVPPGPYTIDQMGDDAAALIRSLDLGPAPVVGWSLGGSVLQALLIRHPGLVSRAVLLSAFPSYTELQHNWLDCLLTLRQSDLPPLAYSVFGMAWGFTPRMLVDHTAVVAGAKLAQSVVPPTSFEGFAAQAHGLRRYDSRGDLPKVETPTLVLVGAEDALTPVSQSVEMADLLPNGRLQVLPRGGHGMAVEYTPDVVAAIRAYLEG